MTSGPQSTIGATDRPFFSIITAMWNRSDTIRRCIESCTGQDFRDFEMIIVDDGSTDDSVSVVGDCSDPRVKLAVLPVNSGMNVARNEGVARSRGHWIITLDSDDALLPGALSAIHAECCQAPSAVGLLGFSYERDVGGVSPDPCPADEMDYIANLRWRDRLVRGDHLTCHRREVFERFQWSDCFWGSSLFHLNVARHWRVRILPTLAGRVYLGAGNRLSRSYSRVAINRLLRWSGKQADECHNVLTAHGEALGLHAPKLYRTMLFGAMFHDLLSSRRARALGPALALLRTCPLAVTSWLVLLLGMVHRRLLAWSWVYGGYWKRRMRKT